MATEAVALNTARLVRTRLVGRIQSSGANPVVDHAGRLEVLPGQGGVVPGIGLGMPAGGWIADHLEPGISIGHEEAEANAALQVLCCVGNRVTLVGGPAAGAHGVVFGKHGAVLAIFEDAVMRAVAPGEPVAIEAIGVGLAIEGEPDIALHSMSPALARHLLTSRDRQGRLAVEAVVTLPAEAAAAGIGMPVRRYNMDLQIDQPPVAALAGALRFGDIVALADHDHRFGREHRAGWLTLGAICHGRAVGGGHGFGLISLASGPAGRFRVTHRGRANLTDLLAGTEGR